MKNEETHKHIKQILSRGTEYRAPAGMSERVLNAVKAREKVAVTHHPLMPTWVWWALVFSSTILIVWALKNSGPASDSMIGGYLSRMAFDFEFPMPAPSPVLLMSLAATLVMLLLNVALVNKTRA